MGPGPRGPRTWTSSEGIRGTHRPVASRRPRPVYEIIRYVHLYHASRHGQQGFSAGPPHRHRRAPLYPGRTVDNETRQVKQKTLRLLLDSRVVDVPMASNLTFVMLSSWKPLFFNSLKNDLCFSDNAGA